MWIRPVAVEPGCRRPPSQIPPTPDHWRAVAALLVALAAVSPAAAAAADAPPDPPAASRRPTRAAAPQDEQLIATVRSNGVLRGDLMLVRKTDGDYWIAGTDLAAMKLTPVEGARRDFGGETYYSFRALGAQGLSFDEASLTLDVNFPSVILDGTRIDLSNLPPPPPPPANQSSLIMSYRLSLRPALQQRRASQALETDLSYRAGPLLLRQAARLDLDANRRGGTRGPTQLIWDDVPAGTRLIAGDALSTAGAFGSAITGAGVLFAKVFDMTPDLIRQPTADLRTSTSLPAEVAVSVDGNVIHRSRVGPGPIALENLRLQGGIRNVQVTVTDAAGRREVIEQPFMFTDSVLAAGLHEFSWFAGKRSGIGPYGEIQYLEPAWQGFHRYGVNDRLTVSAGGEGNRDFTTAGAGAAVRNDALGLIAAEALTSVDRINARRAHGWQLRYTYLLPQASFLLGRRQYGAGFRTFGTSSLNPFLRSETIASLSTRFFRGTLSLEVGRRSDALEARRTGVVRLATSIRRGWTLFAELRRTHSTISGPEWGAQLSVRADLDGADWLATTVRSEGRDRSVDVEYGREIGQAEGLGYRLGATTPLSDGAAPAIGYGSFNWNLKPATLEFHGTAPLQSDRRGGSFAEFALSGALVAVDGSWGLTRRVNDGFVLARLGVPQPGIDISLNNQVQGATDDDGELFIPGVGPYARQDVSLDDQALGLQYSIREKRRTIALPYRGGVVVDFGGRRMHAVAGKAWQVAGGRRDAIPSRGWELRGPAGSVRVESSRSGDFYLEDVAPGVYRGTLELDGKMLACRLVVPDFPEIVHESPEGVTCE